MRIIIERNFNVDININDDNCDYGYLIIQKDENKYYRKIKIIQSKEGRLWKKRYSCQLIDTFVNLNILVKNQKSAKIALVNATMILVKKLNACNLINIK